MPNALFLLLSLLAKHHLQIIQLIHGSMSTQPVENSLVKVSKKHRRCPDENMATQRQKEHHGSFLYPFIEKTLKFDENHSVESDKVTPDYLANKVDGAYEVGPVAGGFSDDASKWHWQMQHCQCVHDVHTTEGSAKLIVPYKQIDWVFFDTQQLCVPDDY